MTSKQVMLMTAALLAAVVLGSAGCEWFEMIDFTGPPSDPLVSPYPTRHVWAIAPLRNESGTRYADGAVMADKLQRQLGAAANLDVLPVNRTIEAMQALQLAEIATPGQARQVLAKLGADGLVIGTITTYEPYDPPKLGLALELYVNEKVEQAESPDLRRLTVAPVDGPPTTAPLAGVPQPVSVVSTVLDGGDARVRDQIESYARRRGTEPDPNAWRRFRSSMDLFSEFGCYVMSWRLLEAEKNRLAPKPGDNSPARP
jgi:hypothetical protein